MLCVYQQANTSAIKVILLLLLLRLCSGGICASQVNNLCGFDKYCQRATDCDSGVCDPKTRKCVCSPGLVRQGPFCTNPPVLPPVAVPQVPPAAGTTPAVPGGIPVTPLQPGMAQPGVVPGTSVPGVVAPGTPPAVGVTPPGATAPGVVTPPGVTPATPGVTPGVPGVSSGSA